MKPLFNFEDETLNQGFQIKMGELSPEQRGHAELILKARNIPVRQQKEGQNWLVYSGWSGEAKYYTLPAKPVEISAGKIAPAYQIIDYPTLCRAAVQLKCGDRTGYLVSDSKTKEVTDYAFVARVSLITVPDGQHGILLIGYSSEGIIDGNELKQEEFEAKLRGISPVVKQSLTTEPVEVSPETEQPKNEDLTSLSKEDLVEEVLRLQGVAHGFIDDLEKEWKENSGLRSKLLFIKHQPLFNRVRALQLEKENSELTQNVQGISDLYRASLSECEVLKSQLQNTLSEKGTLNNALARIAELEAQLAANNELLSNTEQLPVYDWEWLDRCLIGLGGSPYRLCPDFSLVSLNGYALDPKTSSDIILRAVAKELNGGKVGTQIIYWMPVDLEYDWFILPPNDNRGCPLFVDAQKAIDILNQIDPQILKNYFA